MSEAKRILFAAEHCLADPSSGAAVSAVELLGLLRDRGWETAALCGTKMDGANRPPMGSELRWTADERLTVHHMTFRDLPVRMVQGPEEVEQARGALTVLLEAELKQRRPDVLLTYGGGAAGRSVLKAARATGVPSVFWLRNTQYEKRDLFEDVTGGVIVPSAFTARYYSQRLSLRSEVLYPTVVRERVKCPVKQPKYLTFVTPIPEKGTFFVARLISELGRLRPDVEILIVEGRGQLEWFKQTGLSILSQPNVRVMQGAVDPKQFLAVTRILIMPSLWDETFGRTNVEAMVNGIPVIASNRGGLPEVVGTGGVVLDVPERLAQNKTLLASVAEVKPWYDAVLALWDDEENYRTVSRQAVSSAARFDPDVIADRADTLLREWSTHEVDGRNTEPLPDSLRQTWQHLESEAENLLA